MAEENMNVEINENASEAKVEKSAKVKKEKKADKKPNVFVRMGRWIKKFLSDTRGELKKVVWTPKQELTKNSKLVIVTVAIFAVIIAAIDLLAALGINSLAGLIG